MTDYASINLSEKFGRLPGYWQPRVVAELNDYQFKVARIEGDFVWHSHPETDEAFLVLEGDLRIDFRDGAVTIRPGELYVVPKGVEHKPLPPARSGYCSSSRAARSIPAIPVGSGRSTPINGSEALM